MKNTTLCYIEKDGKYLMLHRVKKANDISHDKWLGIGGKFEDKESPEDCVIREAKEETNLNLHTVKYRGIVTFISDVYETEYMHLFTCEDFSGTIGNCDEGELVWIDKREIYDLKLWEGDKIFFRLLEKNEGFFSLKLEYEGDKLVYNSAEVYK